MVVELRESRLWRDGGGERRFIDDIFPYLVDIDSIALIPSFQLLLCDLGRGQQRDFTSSRIAAQRIQVRQDVDRPLPTDHLDKPRQAPAVTLATTPSHNNRPLSTMGLPNQLSRKDLYIGVIGFLLVLAVWQDYLLPSSFYGIDLPRNETGTVYGARHRGFNRKVDYDLVVSYYNEPMDKLQETIDTVMEGLPKNSKRARVIIYHKGDGPEDELLKLADEVVRLKNVGREGATYLNHIVRHYPSGETDFATHTFFLQPHVAWDWCFKPRLPTLTPETGFMSLGPYLNMTRGKDAIGVELPRINDIYTMFRQDFSPPTPVLATWAGQFVVSRRRILSNSFESYRNLLGYFEAPRDHWIWREGWGNNKPSDPTLGHALERSWPTIFDCTDPTMSQTCGEGSGPTCQCRDV
ncbi:hypothetical protein DB88DRAFT_492975 [Papiliotrema laurentii]|uniref:Uncharacterized protein n=1 Tax=Papiliotrema laurentii TaxID=5418 RepID=A0AAD9CVK5_PAPLA|nr:hypothetical protein DB88DRAFT_492975 [Papiliotrema laurentii]